MATSDGYGQLLGERIRVDNAPAIVARALRKTDIAVTEIRRDHPLPGMIGSLQREGAFPVALRLRDFPGHKCWEDGERVFCRGWRLGDDGKVKVVRYSATTIPEAVSAPEGVISTIWFRGRRESAR
jgi:hypothetical protein